MTPIPNNNGMNKMRTMTDPKAFFKIRKNDKTFLDIKTSMAMRFWVGSYGFYCDKVLAENLFKMRKEAQ